MRSDAVLRRLAPAALALLAGCAAPKPEVAVTVETSPVADLKCGGGIAFQVIEVRNLAAEPRLVMPICELHTPGLELVERPQVPARLAPGESARFICAVRDVGDPPDGQRETVLAYLSVRTAGQEEAVHLPVACPRP